MRILGIICEYNPFHLGHAAQLRLSREAVGDIPAVAVMSGSFVQRGEVACFSRRARAEMALAGGADLVLELPVLWAVASAERFALGGAAVLDGLGLPAVLSFGSECGALAPLERAARACTAALPETRRLLKEGMSFPAAREAAVASLIGEEAALLREPNNILGVEYLKALDKLGSDIRPLTVPRIATAHDGSIQGCFAPASALREKLRRGESVADYVPPEVEAILRGECVAGRGPLLPEALEPALLYRLRTMAEEEYASLPDGGEGLWRRLMEAGRREPTAAAVLAAAKTKRYALSRLRRMLTAALLGLTAEEQRGLPAYIRVLGHNARGREVLHAARKTAKLPLITKPAAAHGLPPAAKRSFLLDERAADLAALASPDPAFRTGGAGWRTGAVID